MEIREQTQDGVVVVVPLGRLDSNTCGDFERALAGHLDGARRRVVIDFGGVDYISSAGLRVLLLAARKLKEGEGRLVLCTLAESVRQIFEFAGFLPIFTIEPTRNGALERLAAPA